MTSRYRKTLLALIGLLALPGVAQIKLGEGVVLNHASGTVGAGYTADFGNVIDGSHSLDVSGSGAIDGYYYNPKFISFTATPYYGESRANSNYQSISDSKGVSLSSALFSNSHFPGSVTYSKDYNSLGSFSVPGLPNFTTNTNGQAFGVSWGEAVPGLPAVLANFQSGKSAYSVYGTSGEGQSSSQSLGLHSSYVLAGFNMNGSFTHATSDALTPAILYGGTTQSSSSSSGGDSYSLGASHRMPLNGQASANFNHSNTTYESLSAGSSGNLSFENMSGSYSLRPLSKVNIALIANYTDNLGGEINQQILASGAYLQNTTKMAPSNSLALESTIDYRVNRNLTVSGEVERRVQSWQNFNYGANYYTASAAYSREIPRGSVGVSSSLTEAVQDNSAQKALGSSSSASLARRFGAWSLSANAGYTQNVQTLLISYMTSNYNYSGSVSRRIGQSLYWSAGASSARSGLTATAGDSNSANSFSTSLSARSWFAVSGSYQKSQGQAFLGANGLTQTPILAPVLSSTPLYSYTGDSYSFSASTSAIKHFSAAASYAKALNNTVGSSTSSRNSNEQELFTTRYQMRKISLIGGYSRFTQGFSSIGQPAPVMSSFYVGVTRWFKAF